MRAPLAAFLLLLALLSPARADTCLPQAAERVAVADLDGLSVGLSDGRTVRLAGLIFPAEAEAAAGAALKDMLAGGVAVLGNRSASPDRHGRLHAQVFLADGRHVQAELLRRGLALVMTLRDERACATVLLEAENQGRTAGAGLWADPHFAIASAENPQSFGEPNRYRIAQGRVISVGRTASTVYLDFGRNWSTDFTVATSSADAAELESEGLALNDLKGRRVRVRGWLTESNGPMIRIDHPEQIEVLDR